LNLIGHQVETKYCTNNVDTERQNPKHKTSVQFQMAWKYTIANRAKKQMTGKESRKIKIDGFPNKSSTST